MADSADKDKLNPAPTAAAQGDALSDKAAKQAVDAWQDSGKLLTWSADPKTRAALIFGSRLLATAAFTGGTRLSEEWIKGYDASKPLLQQSFEGKRQLNPTIIYAKAVDNFIGRPIRAIVKFVTGNEETARRAVHFRPTHYQHQRNGYDGIETWGRTLGEEATMLASGFYCMSVTNAAIQDVIQWLDPHVKKTWTDKDGAIKPLEAAKAFGKSWWSYLSYRGGEDLAVCATFYPYALRLVRNTIDHFSPGFGYVSDQGLYSGGFILSGEMPKGEIPKITRSFRRENAIDFQLRFAMYNGAYGVPGTMHFREIYNHIANRLAGKPSSLYGPSTAKAEYKGIVGTASDLFKWYLSDTIKASISMTPTVIPFWAARATQAVHKGIFVHPEYGMMTIYDSKNDKYDPFTINDIHHAPDKNEAHTMKVNLSKYNYSVSRTSNNPYDGNRKESLFARDKAMVDGKEIDINAMNPSAWTDHTRYPDYDTKLKFHPYDQEYEGKGWMGRIADEFGRGQHEAAQGAAKLTTKLATEGTKFHKEIKQFTHDWVRDMAAYPTYFTAKDYFQRKVDTHKTDMANERMIEGAMHLNWGEFKAGAGELVRSVFQQPFADPAREKEAERRNKLRNASQIEEFTDAPDVEDDDDKKKMVSWRRRMVTAPSDNGKSSSYAEQEEMRKTLRDAEPPTKSVH